ncbi:MAG: hypothetical protein OXU64_03130 [Gemmatimonadota bacterium]|nr:hypothetical protein [Gemmatimonadota bacterium]
MSNQEKLYNVLRRDGFIEVRRSDKQPPIQHMRLRLKDGTWGIERGKPGQRTFNPLPNQQPAEWVLMPIFKI